MRSAHITRRQAEARLDGLDTDTDDVFAVQEDTLMRLEREQVRWSAEVDQLLEQIDRKLVASQRIAAARQRVGGPTDARSPRRGHRRSQKVALAQLPTRDLAAAAAAGAELDGEAA